MAPTTRGGPNTPINNTNPNNMTPESIQAMIDQTLLRNATNGDGSHSSHGDNRRNVQTTRPCFYADFMKCQPLNFKGAEGVVGLTRWIEKMESVFNISGCAVENQVKFATCTLLGAALTWWNGQLRTLGPEAYAMTWEVLKKKMTDKYCPQGEIKKLEIELWNLKVRGNDIPAYTERFQELTLICTKFVANETEKIDKYLSGLPDNIYGNVKAAKPKTLDEIIELASDLMDRKLLTYAERQSDNKRRADDSSRNNQNHQQQPFKRQNVAKVYNMGTGERKPYGGSLPKCNKCHLHHNGPCTQRCHKCNKIGHFARDCRSTGNTNVANSQKGNGATPKGNGCFECGASGHFKRDCPKLKKDGGNGNAQGWVYAVGNAEKRGNAPGNPDANVVTGTFLLNNHYASILFDTGADRSFISTAFSSLINIAPTSLENCYDVELADGKLVAINTIIRGCTLNFLDHPFNIDLMPVELGSFDVIIGMDWLRSSNGRESRLAVISYSKAQEYVAKGCQVFLAQISAKKEEDKSERKQIKDVPIVRDFPEVFPPRLGRVPHLGEPRSYLSKRRTDHSGCASTTASKQTDICYPEITSLEYENKERPGRRSFRTRYVHYAVSGYAISETDKPHLRSERDKEETSLKQFELLKEETVGRKVSKCENFWIPRGTISRTRHDSRGHTCDPPMIESNIKEWASPKTPTDDPPDLCLQILPKLVKQKLCSAPILALPEGKRRLCGILDRHTKGLGKANVVADALSRKERIEPLRVRALVMTIGLIFPNESLKLISKPRNQWQDTIPSSISVIVMESHFEFLEIISKALGTDNNMSTHCVSSRNLTARAKTNPNFEDSTCLP
ncbi:putative reverse transcriptase domain-containing protein [Tanacetum coccineum]